MSFGQWYFRSFELDFDLGDMETLRMAHAEYALMVVVIGERGSRNSRR